MVGKRNLAASVTARPLDRAKRTGQDYNVLLTAYGIERFLYRVGVSRLHDRFALKGAVLLRVRSDDPYRATRAGTWPPGGPWQAASEVDDA